MVNATSPSALAPADAAQHLGADLLTEHTTTLAAGTDLSVLSATVSTRKEHLQ